LARPALVLLLAVLCLAAPARAQTTFQRTYGDELYDGGYSVAQTTDGGYIIAGFTNSYGAGSYDVRVVKTDARGDTAWTRTIGTLLYDQGHWVSLSSDGGLVIAGCTTSWLDGYQQVYLAKCDATGDTVWTRSYGGADHDRGYSATRTSDGGYAITGYTYSYGAGSSDIYLVRTDSLGDTLWTRTYGNSQPDEGRAVKQTEDGGFIITGCTRLPGGGASDLSLVRTDAEGHVQWTRSYGGTYADAGGDVVQEGSRGFTVVGHTESFGAGRSDVWLLRTDVNGDSLWTRTFGGPNKDYGYALVSTEDGGYVIVGSTESFGAGDCDVWVIRIDARGNSVWSKTFGGESTDEGHCAVRTTDGGYAITGCTESFGAGAYDVWLIKTDANGNIGVAETPPVAVTPASLPTFARNSLILPSAFSVLTSDFVLFDPSGRKVMNLSPGPNDISHLSPGVYFVCPKGQRDEGTKGQSQKVIIQR